MATCQRNVSTFGLAILILISVKPCNSISREFLYETLKIQNHSDVVYITETIPASIPQRFLTRYQMSHVEKLKIDSTFLSKLNKSDSHSIKLVISYPTVLETIQTISQIGSSPELQSYPLQPWILALWPDEISERAEAVKIIQENLAEVAKNVTIKQELFIAFHIAISDAELFSKYLFYEVYSIENQLVFREVDDLGTTIVQCAECDSLPQRRFNLQGVSFRVEGVEDSEYNDDTLFMENENGQLVFNNSLAKKLTDIMQTALNFTMNVTRSMEWGKQLSDGSWVGAIKDVVDGVTDICVTSVTMLPQRATMIGFLPPTDEIVISAFFLPPSLNAIRDIFMQPFQPTLWAAVIATWLTLALAMVVFTMIRKKIGAHNAYKPDSDAEEPDFTQDSLIWALATVCQQGWDEHPNALSLRAIFISASFTGVIAYAGYSAAIVSTLSLRIDPIQSPQALVKSNLRLGLRLGFLNDVLLQSQAEGSRDDIITDIKSRLSKRPGESVVNVTTATSLLTKQPYAFIGTRKGFYDILKVTKPEKSRDEDTMICSIKELQILKQSFKGGMFTTKLFPFREYFRLILLIIRERGILWRLRTEFTYKRRCIEATDNSGRALGANDVFTAFIVISLGYCLSLMFLVLEKLIRFNSVIYIR